MGTNPNQDALKLFENLLRTSKWESLRFSSLIWQSFAFWVAAKSENAVRIREHLTRKLHRQESEQLRCGINIAVRPRFLSTGIENRVFSSIGISHS